MDHLWDEGDRCYRVGRRGRVGDQRRPAHDPRGGRAARSPRRRPRRRPRARAGRPDVRVAAVERARPRHAARQDVPRRRLAVQRALGRRGDGEVGRPQGRRGAGLRVARARRPRDRGRRGAAHGLARAALRARRLLPLPQRPPQPDQLERRGLRPRRDDDRRHLAAAPRLLPAHAALRGRRAPAVAGRPPRAPVLRRLDQPGPGLPLQLPDHAPARATPSTSTPPSTRTSPCTSCSGTRGRAPPGMPALPRGDRDVLQGLGRARAARLLDPQRLSQLGLGAGPQALADRQDLRLRAAGAARHRARRRLPRSPRVRRRGRSTSSIAAWGSTRAGPTRRAAGRSRPPG